MTVMEGSLMLSQLEKTQLTRRDVPTKIAIQSHNYYLVPGL